MRASLVGLVATLVTLPFLASCSSAKPDSGFTTPQGDNGNGATTQPAGDAGPTTTEDGGPAAGNLLGGVAEAGAGDAGTTTIDGGFQCVKNTSQYDIPANGCDDDDDGIHRQCSGLRQRARARRRGGGVSCKPWASAGPRRTRATGASCPRATRTATRRRRRARGTSASSTAILSTFGTVLVPREGYMLGALSSGSATATDSDTGPYFKGEEERHAGACRRRDRERRGRASRDSRRRPVAATVSSEVNDVIDLKVQIRVPTNANGFSFDFNFMSGEWPDSVCSTFNDSFIAYLTSKAFNGGNPGNISFDTSGIPISVNNNFFQACTAGVPTGCDGNAARDLDVHARPGPARRDGLHRREPRPGVLRGRGQHERRWYRMAHVAGAGAAGRGHQPRVSHLGHGRRELRLERLARSPRLGPRSAAADADHHPVAAPAAPTAAEASLRPPT